MVFQDVRLMVQSHQAAKRHFISSFIQMKDEYYILYRSNIGPMNAAQVQVSSLMVLLSSRSVSLKCLGLAGKCPFAFRRLIFILSELKWSMMHWAACANSSADQNHPGFILYE